MSFARPVLPSKPKSAVRLLFVGDVFGKPGVEAVSGLLPGLIRSSAAEFTVVNGENAEQGKGLVPSVADSLFHAGADVITGGNHTLFRDKIHVMMEQNSRLLRPHNYPQGTVGRGYGIYDVRGGLRIAVVNLQGRAMLTPCDDPFRLGKTLLSDLRNDVRVSVVDFHAEATAEKLAFARYVDGLTTAVIGTHTHVQTADECILPEGTAYLTDVGMTGSHAGVIGLKTEHAWHRFLYPNCGNKSGGAEGDVRLSAVIIDASMASGRALAIHRLQLKMD